VAAGNVTVDPNGNQAPDNTVTYKFVLDNTINKTVLRVETADGAGVLRDREFSLALMG
jgi:hypothetical protein